MIKKIICTFLGHQWIEWSHGPGGYPRSKFIIGKALLKNPYCARCEAKRFKTKKEEWDYRMEWKKQFTT